MRLLEPTLELTLTALRCFRDLVGVHIRVVDLFALKSGQWACIVSELDLRSTCCALQLHFVLEKSRTSSDLGL